MLKKYASTKLLFSIFIVTMLILPVQPAQSKNASDWWDDEWSFRQKIDIPIDTSLDHAKYQPVDTHVEFTNPCWAKNEDEHSIRIITQFNDKKEELECQIYDLKYAENTYVMSCNVVFLIPGFATGSESYYVYYDNTEKNPPGYPNHVDIDEGYYLYEPIPGFPFESKYFKITQDGYVIYGASQEGKFLGLSSAQQITKFKEKTTQVSTPQYGEVWASFDYFYYWGEKTEEFSSTIDKLISKKILINGNLMVKFSIISGTNREDFQTTATYTYYYCPTDYKRLYTHVRHEALKETKIYKETDSFGNILGLQCGNMKSPSIKELNFGKMFPYMHVYKEDNIIQEYPIDIDPDYTTKGITILNSQDDVDLGEKTWTCFDEGETGEAHGIILDSNDIILSGSNERNGVQVQAIEGATPGLLGLETNLFTFFFSRNSYEKGQNYDYDVPKDFVVEFNADFFSTSNGGYPAVKHEAEIFQSLIKLRSSYQNNITYNYEAEGSCSLTAYIHFAPSIPIGSTLCLLTGKKIPYITAELYKDGEIIGTGIVRRIETGELPSFENTNLLQKIKSVLDFVDWKNITFFKKIKFGKLQPGKYLIKIYRENPLFGSERKFIGLQTLEITGDTKTNIVCGSEGYLQISVEDQYANNLENAKILLEYENQTIAETITAEEEKSVISAPCQISKNYKLKVLYKGFIIHEESLKLGFLKSIIPLEKSVKTSVHDFILKLKDTWGFPPDIELNPILTSNKMEEKYQINGVKKEPGCYLFTRLPSNIYNLDIKYKSFSLEKTIIVPEVSKKNYVFPAEFKIESYVYDLRGGLIKNAKIIMKRDGHDVSSETDDKGIVEFNLPPGGYHLSVYKNDQEIGKRKLTVLDEREVELVTLNDPVLPYVVVILTISIFIACAIICFNKKNYQTIMKLFAIALVVIAVFSPWWMITGCSNVSSVESTTNLYMIPSVQITMTTTPDVIAGERSPLPEIASQAITVLIVALILGCILLFCNIVFTKYKKKRCAIFSFSLATILFLGVLFMFFFIVSEMVKVGVGTFFGQGNIDVNIVGEGITEIVKGSWGPGFGFYLLFMACIILVLLVVYNIKKRYVCSKC